MKAGQRTQITAGTNASRASPKGRRSLTCAGPRAGASRFGASLPAIWGGLQNELLTRAPYSGDQTSARADTGGLGGWGRCGIGVAGEGGCFKAIGRFRVLPRLSGRAWGALISLADIDSNGAREVCRPRPRPTPADGTRQCLTENYHRPNCCVNYCGMIRRRGNCFGCPELQVFLNLESITAIAGAPYGTQNMRAKKP